MPSLLVSLSAVVQTLGISAPTVVDAVRGKVTVARCDERLRRWATHLLDEARVSRTVHNIERVAGDETFIVMSNHKSLYDVPLLIESYPHTLRMVAKTELFRVPIWGAAMREAGFIEIDRNDRKRAKAALEVAKARLNAGVNVWIAPEGTRSRNGELGAFKSGGFRLALDTGHRILPVGIRGTEKILPAEGIRVNLGAAVELEFGEPVDPAAYGNGKRAQLVNVVRDAIEAMVERKTAS